MSHLLGNNGPIKLSLIIATLLASGCSDFSVRNGLNSTPSKDTTLSSKIKDTESEQYAKEDPRFYLPEAAKIAEEEGDYVTATGHWKNLVEQFPSDKEAIIGFSKAGRTAGLSKTVLSMLYKLQSDTPQDTLLMSEISKAHYTSGEYKNALEQINSAIALEDMNWSHYSLRGAIYDKMSDYSEAEKSYQKALELSPDNPTVLNNYAVSRMMAGDIDGAERYAYDASQSEGANIATYNTYVKVLGKQGRLEDAEKFLSEKTDEKTAKKMMSNLKSEFSAPILWGRNG